MNLSFQTPKLAKSHSSTILQRTPYMSPTFSNTCRVGNDVLYSQDDISEDMSMNQDDKMICNEHGLRYPINMPSREASQRTINEVDYYHNPTELFRWINYRRWDGAKKRVEVHPEEASVWISSRNDENSIRWRSLPLHLVCMQSYVKHYIHNEHDKKSNEHYHLSDEEVDYHNQGLKDVDSLIDELLRVYPKAVREKDHNGMLPLHVCINRIDDINTPNDAVIMYLLLSYPSGVHIRDNYGRTPLDILRQKQERYPNLDRTLRIMLRASEIMTNTIEYEHIDDDNMMTPSLHRISEDESSQYIPQVVHHGIVQEISHDRDNIDSNESLTKITIYDDVETELQKVEKERGRLFATIAGLRNEIDNHDGIIVKIRPENNAEVEKYKQQLSSLQSELNATRPLSLGTETELTYQFSKREHLSSTASNIEEKFNVLGAKSSRENENDEIDDLKVELKQSKSLEEESTQKKVYLKKHSNNVEMQVDRICGAFASLLAKYDHTVETYIRNEAQLISNIQAEREECSASLDKFQKQLKLLYAFTADFRQKFIDSANKEASLMEQFMGAKKDNTEAVAKIKCELSDIISQFTHVDYETYISGSIKNETKSKKSTSSDQKIEVEDQSLSSSSIIRERKGIDQLPYPKVKSPFLLEMLERRALESTRKQTSVQQAEMEDPPMTPISSSDISKIASGSLQTPDVRQQINSIRAALVTEETHFKCSDFESNPICSSIVTPLGGNEKTFKNTTTAEINQNTDMGDISILRSKYSSPK